MIILGEKYTNEIKELQQYDRNIVTFKPNKNLVEEINNHADIHIFKHNKTLIVSDKIVGDIAPEITGYNIETCKDIRSPYPEDIKLNVLFINNKIICNTKYVAREIIELSKKYNIQLLHTNQGYSKCSVCKISDTAVITDSVSIASLLKICQIDVLTIKPGNIALSNEHYGFIGGASGLINEQLLYFSGDISKHPDYENILDFTNKHNIKIIFNKNRPLTDFGGFIKL